MPLLKNLSRKAIIALSLLVWFVPFVPLIFIFLHDPVVPSVMRGLVELPFISGVSLAFLFLKVSGMMHGPEWLVWLLGIVPPTAFTVLMLRASNWRKGVLLAGFFTACASSWFAYMVLRA